MYYNEKGKVEFFLSFLSETERTVLRTAGIIIYQDQDQDQIATMVAVSKALDSMAKLVRAAKCYSCIHRFEPKPKKTFARGGIFANQYPGETVLPNINRSERNNE